VGSDDNGGFLYNKGKYQTLSFPGSSQTQPWGINDNGIVVGWYYGCTPTCADHAFAIMKGKYLSFDYPGAMGTFSGGINYSGQIVGSYTLDNQTFHGFLTSPITTASFADQASTE